MHAKAKENSYVAYRCQDCTYKSASKSRFPGGRCPACGSFNIKSTEANRGEEKEEDASRQRQLVILVALWGAFLLTVAYKLLF